MSLMVAETRSNAYRCYYCKPPSEESEVEDEFVDPDDDLNVNEGYDEDFGGGSLDW